MTSSSGRSFLSLIGAPKSLSYRLLSALVLPRPIALVTTSSPSTGVLNTAPFSFFNLIGADPPMCILGIDNKADGSAKDTLFNLNAEGSLRELTVSLVDRDTIDRAVLCATNLPRNVSEMDTFGLTAVPSHLVTVPSISECKVTLECKDARSMIFGRNNVVVAEIVAVTAAEGVITAKGKVDYSKFMPVGRFKSPGGYCDLVPFEIKWPNSDKQE